MAAAGPLNMQGSSSTNNNINIMPFKPSDSAMSGLSPSRVDPLDELCFALENETMPIKQPNQALTKTSNNLKKMTP